MKAGLHLHLFYPDVALELIGRVAALGAVDVIATYHGSLPADVAAALDALPGAVERIETPNLGWDLGPLLHILPRVAALGWDLIGHLHTKKGGSGYAAEWRAIAYDGMIVDADLVGRIAAAFADPAVMLAGPEPLYKSAASHQFRNGEVLSALAPRLMAPNYPPADWGFFAGSFFWTRPALLERLAALVRFDGSEDERDGTLAHALERLVGLTPLATGGLIALVDEGGAIETVRAPGSPSHEPIIRTLVDRAERFVAPIDPELAALIGRHNPLVDYIRHGRDADALDPNPYFSSDWYNRIQADVFAAGMHPLHHYMHHGWPEGRSTGPLFDGRHYRFAYDDVTGDPLRHFLEVGARAGRVAIPVTRPEHGDAAERPKRFYRHFDIAREAAFLAEMTALPAEISDRAAATKVSVIMPAWNREATVGAAIRSVLAQTHERFELIVVDDGSTDGTRAEVARFAGDPRVRLVEGAHRGVSAARNLGLAHATGDVVAYLDSDNRWTAWFLEVMTRHLAATGVEAAYCGIALRDDLGQLTGYRGDDFDWEACLHRNYVDLNAFVHARALLGEVGTFDTSLRRMVDWDLILRLTKGRAVGYAPFVGCDYFDGRADGDRITTAEPSAFQKLVWTKNRRGLETGTAAFRDALSLTIAIKIAAPEDEKAAWGDFHFAESLADAFERLGNRAVIDFRDQWTGRPTTEEDVVLVLRGLIPYAPRPGQLALLWAISHPDQIGPAEMDRYARVYVASESHAALLRHVLKAPVAALPQATDPVRFHPIADLAAGPELLFVGNSRRVERDVVRWAIEAGHPPVIVGQDWDGIVPADLVEAENVANAELGARYAAAGAVLNDHWPSMRAFGYLSNRLYDAVASGARVISDAVPSLAATFGDAVVQVDGPAALAAALPALLERPRDLTAAERIGREESFDARAQAIVGDVLAMLGVAPARVPAAPRGPLRVHAIISFAPHGPRSSSYIRLACPLTDDSVVGQVSLSLGAAGEAVPDCQVCIVQRTALSDAAAVDALVGRLGETGTRLVTDVDDAFTLMDAGHAETALYRPLNAALERAIAASAETWFSTAPLARAYAHVAHRRHILPNAVDPRLWRDWRHPRAAMFDGAPLRLLCMGTNTHGPDFEIMRNDLDRLWARRPGGFAVSVIGMAPDLAPAPWLHRLNPPVDAVSYPRFVHWLRGQGPFDCGLAPLARNDFNRAKSDIKLLDYAALGLLPIASDMPGYLVDPVLKELAMWAGDWEAAVEAVIVDPRWSAERAAAAQAHVWAKRNTAAMAADMLTRLEALIA